jgi:hypothetical protein
MGFMFLFGWIPWGIAQHAAKNVQRGNPNSVKNPSGHAGIIAIALGSKKNVAGAVRSLKETRRNEAKAASYFRIAANGLGNEASQERISIVGFGSLEASIRRSANMPIGFCY